MADFDDDTEENLIEDDSPELPPASNSEIEALVDVNAKGPDEIYRPVLVNQMEEDVLALTYEDAVRLHGFLGVAVQYLREYRNRNLQ